MKRLRELCSQYGLLVGKDDRGGRVTIWGGKHHLELIGIVWLSDDWETIEQSVIGWALESGFCHNGG